MGENSAIEWTEHTFNPWTGCTRVSPGCDNCYAAALAKRSPATFGSWEPGAERKRTSEAYWRQPLAWNRKAEREGRRARVFCASMADVFDNQVPETWRLDLWALIHATPHLDWLLLTKRPQNIARMLPRPATMPCFPAWGEGWPNVWLGTTVENQAEADRRIPHLLCVPAKVLFLSCEPLLGPLDLHRISVGRQDKHLDALFGILRDTATNYCDGYSPGRVRWVIAGGESGSGARPMHPDWARSLRDQCSRARVPFFFKQWGAYSYRPVDPEGAADHLSCVDAQGRLCALSRGEDDRAAGMPWWFLPPGEHAPWAPSGIPAGVVECRHTTKKAAGAELDGREHREIPHG